MISACLCTEGLESHVWCRCGNVASAIIEKDIVGNPKGIAVVEFDSEPARKVALTLSGAKSSLFECHLVPVKLVCLET